jgi:hypothetical protein
MRIDARTLNDPLAALQASFDVRPAPSRRNVAAPVEPEGGTWEAMRRAVEKIQSGLVLSTKGNGNEDLDRTASETAEDPPLRSAWGGEIDLGCGGAEPSVPQH